MFLSDVLKKEECRNEALQELRKLGIKCRPKKPKQQNVKSSTKVFKVPLKSLSTETVTLKTGQQVAVPKLVHQMCSFILTKVSTEGLFRKEGSKVRQGDMKLILNGGGVLDTSNHIIDIAALLKTFLRELPEPLIPSTHHELFLRCVLQDVGQFKPEALLLACLLLPIEHLNTLTYLLQFFLDVSEHSGSNKMNSYNLAVVIGPAVFPLDDKLSQTTAQMRTAKICEIVQILIENALEVGILPENIIERLGSTSAAEIKKKKRRSGSLTRMFNGLKKMVGGKNVEENIVTPDLLLTPINNNVLKKRRLQSNGISVKKKKELLNKLPDNVLLSTPFTPCRTPVSMDLSGAQINNFKNSNELIKEKKSQWFSRSKSLKNLKQENETCKRNGTTKAILERRWSAINPSNNLKKAKKRNSFSIITSSQKENISEEPDYIRVSKTEYEAIKNRVTAMERRISMELESVQCQIKTDNENNTNEEVDVNIQNVQTVYEQTLNSAQLSPTTDQLAKRLSRELKIRRSCEQKIIRSPSARKIGSMRRKSKENEKSNSKIVRHQSWHVAPRGSIPRVSLKRGKPNTVSNGLPANKNDEETPETKNIRTRSSSVGAQSSSTRGVSCNLSGSSNDTWVSAEGFFSTVKSNNNSSNAGNGRASLARLRNQNAGMVLAKAKLFDKLSDSESSNSFTRSLPRAKVGTKIGSSRHPDSRLSYRVRTLKYEERRITKKSMSPRRRNGQLSQKHKIQIAKQYLNSSSEQNSDKENIPDNFNNLQKSAILKGSNKDVNQKFASPKYSTPRAPPHIKKPLNVRSPKRLCRTPVGVERGTPLRVLKTPQTNI